MLHLGECAIRAPPPPSRHVPTQQWLSNRCSVPAQLRRDPPRISPSRPGAPCTQSRFSSRVLPSVSMQSAHSTKRPILAPTICISLLVGIQFSLYFGVVPLTSHVPRVRTGHRRAVWPTMTLCSVAVRQRRASSQPCISSAGIRVP